ncbi:U-box domain-containing protein 26-like [Panicum miliaceum]|uniref:U-box domain-containing protein 26-like n=1 Tax=Panicum miliaceum TaxID=4540 RepID=A0A3L6QQW9_PANMI|nr:U-box domain-containing protein 26-like [Panicum miliaceum]
MWVLHVSLLPQLPTSPTLSPSTSPAPPVRPPTSSATSERRQASLLRPLPSPLPPRHRSPCSGGRRAHTWPGRCALPRRGRGPVTGVSWPLPRRAFPALWIRGLFALWMANENRPRSVSAGATSTLAQRVAEGGAGEPECALAAVEQLCRAEGGRDAVVAGAGGGSARWKARGGGLKLRNKADVGGPYVRGAKGTF